MKRKILAIFLSVIGLTVTAQEKILTGASPTGKSDFIYTKGNISIGNSYTKSVLNVLKKPIENEAHLFLGNPLSETQSDVVSSRLCFAGTGIQHAGFAWVPSTYNSNGNGKLHLSFGGYQNPMKNPIKVTFKSNGNVGVGTTDPKAGLHVVGNRSVIAEGLFYFRNTKAPVNKKNWYFSANNEGDFGLHAANDNYGWRQSIFKVKGDSGYVGFGTSNPNSKLEVKGSKGSYHQMIVGGGVAAAIQLESKDNITQRPVISANDGDFSIQMWKNRNTWMSTPFTIESSGNVGFGTSNPNSKLEVKGSKGSYHQMIVGGGVAAAIQLESKDNITQRPVISANDGEFSIQMWRNRNTWISTPFRINSSGKVGIGTSTTGSHRLAVEGSIGAREIKVEATGWSDFVFEENYQLPTLKEVESHINEKGHLKDIPSAEKVKKDGFFLGEMDAKLLQKIEELTLYTIDQEKKLEAQDLKINKQDAEIRELKALNKMFIDLQDRLKRLESKN
ncbi:hypothetical protein [Tenacibaculum soleae]|uniref:hypothetical protein n=1 Tax=Tenacibaculum soleae TaxID=447689 RepID=UPI0026E11C7B|nr:hypothetical protein [Tenacibaculum soleae]MDO6812710.1 hypothetical protein [Tenacibaculum soleae]